MLSMHSRFVICNRSSHQAPTQSPNIEAIGITVGGNLLNIYCITAQAHWI